MRILLQRISEGWVDIEGTPTEKAGVGLLALVGFAVDDEEAVLAPMVKKLTELRIFEDDQGKMNRSCLDVQGDILVVSQFTLAGDCSRGRRPGFDNAAAPEDAKRLYSKFVKKLAESGLNIQEGRFGAHMQVDIVNDGPVTFILER